MRVFLAGNLPKNALKSRRFTGEVHGKVNNTLRQSEVRATCAVKTDVKRAKMVPSPDPPDPPDPGYLVHGLRLGTSPTRAGGQDDVSLDKLPQTINISAGIAYTYIRNIFLV